MKTEELPLFYGDLRRILKGVTTDMVQQPWFWEFLLHHPVFEASLVPKKLVELLH